MPMKVMSASDRKRVGEIRGQISKLAAELRGVVKPTNQEIRQLLEDIEMNPQVYTSYFEDDDLFLSENVYDERTNMSGKEDDNGDVHYEDND